MPRNRTTSDSQPILQEESDTFDLNSDSTADHDRTSLKQLLLQRSWEYWNVKQNEKYAIFYQTISFCLYRNCSVYQDDVFNYLEKLKKEVSFQGGIDKAVYNYSNFDDINKFLDREINYTCRQRFPKEWTIVQLTKNFNPVTLSSKFEDIVNYNTGISMTIFKHSAIKDILMLEIKKQSHSAENLFEKVYKLNKKIIESLNYKRMPQDTPIEIIESKEKYWKASKELDVYVQEMIALLKTFIGPWACALTGNFKNRKSVETENEIRKKVYEFLKLRNFSEHQEKLIQLLARRTDLLSHQQIFVAITYILRDKSNLGYNDLELNDLYDYLTWIKQEYVYDDVSTHPCILIVDDLLDQIPFEMVNTQQEFTRVCSFANLKRLYERYSGSIDNGYVVCSTVNCQAIVNPDESLSLMEDRMKNFFNYWLPSWKVSYRQKPTNEEFLETLSQSDVMVYCGHGSGLTLCDNVYNLKTKAIVFLFGCGSVSLSSAGLCSDLKGAHVYYHMGWSPVVIGFLWTVTDFNTDFCSSKILSAWLNSPQTKAHWQCIDKVIWKKNGNLAFTKVGDITSSDSLSEVIAKMHNDNDLPVSIRASLVYRGLPVINSTK